ncbi:MAG: hypothetical protein JJU28_15795 [Cyclobacteriaceae bacterium]|nr:hypothetical protein [Cyclobacteriaceae bacterium]
MRFFEKYIFQYYFLASLLTITSCDKDVEQPDFEEKVKLPPFVETIMPTDNDGNGITFNAKFGSIDPDIIEAYGFDVHYYFNEDYSIQMRTAYLDTDSTFKYRLTTDLLAGGRYIVKAFVKTINYHFYGLEIEFISNGSTPVIIHDFFPKEGADGTLIHVIGSNFGHMAHYIQLNIENAYMSPEYASSDTLVFKIMETVFTGDVELGLYAAGKKIFADSTFYIYYPKILSISDSVLQYGQKFTLTGDFRSCLYQNTEIYLANVKTTTLSISDTEIEVEIPVAENFMFSADYHQAKIRIVNGRKDVTWEKDLTFKSPWQIFPGYPFYYESYQYISFKRDEQLYFLDLHHKLLYMYRFDWNYWSPVSSYPGQKHKGGHAFVAGDKVIKMGGPEMNEKEQTNEWWTYNFSLNLWKEMEPLPFYFYSISSFKLHNQWYILTDESELYRYDQVNEHFDRLRDFPHQLQKSSFYTFSLKDKAYTLLAGKTYQYMSDQDTWVFVGDNPFTAQEHLLLRTGMHNENSTWLIYLNNFLYRFEPESNTWIYEAVAPNNYCSSSGRLGFVIDNSPYIMYFPLSRQGCEGLLYKYIGTFHKNF